MISLPGDWSLLTQALSLEEKGRLVDALAALTEGRDPGDLLQGAERVLFPILAARQKKSKFVQSDVKKSQNSDINKMQRMSKFEQDEVKESQNSDKSTSKKVNRQEERDEREKKERTKERREKEEREEYSLSLPGMVVSELTYSTHSARAREDGDSVSHSVTTTILEAWNSTPGLQTVRMTQERLHQIETLINTYGAEDVVRVFRDLRNKPFLLGENRRGWVVLWRWIVTPSNFAKVLDGDYDPPRTAPGSMPASYDINRAMDQMRTTVPALTKKRR